MARRCPVPAVLVVFLVLVAACGGGDSAGDDDSSGGTGTETCPVDALEAADGPVEITFWYNQPASNAEVLGGLLADFEAAHPEVRVEGVQVPTYREMRAKYRAGLASGQLPDVVQLEDTAVQAMLDSGSSVTMQACVDADGYDLSDFLPATIDFYSTDGTLRAMPWTVSHPVLFYDKAKFVRAGLDPDRPPATLDEVREYSQRLVDADVVPHGITLRIQDYYNEFFWSLAGEPYVDNENGRAARATKANLDNEPGLEIWTWWKDMVDSGLALNTGSIDGNYDHLTAIGTGQSAMTFEGSPALGPIKNVLGQGDYEGVEIGVGPFPGLETGGGIPVSDGALWIVNRSSAEEQAAAWRLVKFLDEPEQQAALSAGTGTIPIRESSLELPEIRDLWAAKPEYRVAYDQLVNSPDNVATRGPLIGDYEGVRNAVRDAITAMLEQGLSPKEALERAQRDADAAITAYNERIG